MSNSVRPHRWQPTMLPHPWDSPGKNTGVGCHFLLQRMKVKSEKWKVKVKPLSRVRFAATPGTAAYQASLSMGFSRLEYWSGVPLLSPSNSPKLYQMKQINSLFLSHTHTHARTEKIAHWIECYWILKALNSLTIEIHLNGLVSVVEAVGASASSPSLAGTASIPQLQIVHWGNFLKKNYIYIYVCIIC